jgi:23S rRNA (adenine2030-N6)-methyltransferase
MLSYRHAYHAGLHADVFKHLVLTLLARSLLQKDKPFFYLDTHAGPGCYDLGSEMAQKNREFETGIARLWSEDAAPEPVMAYLDVVRRLNPPGRLRMYPGSPRIVRDWLRPRDRMTLCELHPKDTKSLRTEFAEDRQVRVETMDGYQALKALLPPAERRGLVHVDPAFERKDERRLLLEALQEGYRRWAAGIYAVWFPIQDRSATDDFRRRLERSGIRKILLAEFSVLDQDETRRLIGSGMAIINPPWQLDETLRDILPWLWEKLSVDGQGEYRLDWLVGE